MGRLPFWIRWDKYFYKFMVKYLLGIVQVGTKSWRVQHGPTIWTALNFAITYFR